MMPTATSHYLGDFTDDAYRALRGSEDTDAGELSRGKSIAQYLNPWNTERFVKREPMSGLKRDSIIFDAYPDTAIVASKLFETNCCRDISIIGHLTAKEFLPSTPSWHMKSKPREYWP